MYTYTNAKHQHRHDVLEFEFEKYGKDHVAQ